LYIFDIRCVGCVSTDGWPEEDVLKVIRLNAIFPTLLTRALLPGLRRTSLERPVLVAFIGSQSAKLNTPRVCVYAACKAYIHRLSSCLHADERFDSPNSNLSFMVVETGTVGSNSMHQEASWVCPSSDDYAKLVVNSLGCRKRLVNPHIGHAINGGFVQYVPDGILAPLMRAEMKKTVEIYSRWEGY
jgi:17beta-estradiol 17-dehydrogenase / very-long-chain 3-oxoacyl-CoA reductase